MFTAPGAASVAGLLACTLFSCAGAPHPEAPRMSVATGRGGVLDKDSLTYYRAEYRHEEFTRHALVPTLGVAWTDEKDLFLSTKLRRNFWINDRIVVTPGFGGGYWDGDEPLQLRGPIMFSTGVEVAYRWANGTALGLSFSHLSNAGLAAHNPGTEVLLLDFSMPLGRRRAGGATGAGPDRR